MTNTHVLEVFVHENEEEDPVSDSPRSASTGPAKHALNAYWMLYEPEQLQRLCGAGSPAGIRRRWSHYTRLNRAPSSSRLAPGADGRT